MNRNQLDDLIAQGEHTRLEFKRQLSTPYRIARTLTAFANTSGGILLIGIADSGKIAGVPSELREMEKIEEAAERLIQPPISVSYKTLTPDGRLVLIVTVEESDEKPHYVLDEAGKRTMYIRAKDKSVPTSKLIITPDTADRELLKSPMARTLIQYLRQHDFITADKFAKLINISTYRANKHLQQLAERGLLLIIDKPRPTRYALKLSE